MKYDKDKEEGKTLEAFPLDVEVAYAAFKGKMMVSGRDFVYSIGVVRNDAGQVAIASTATEHDAMPPTKKKVRGHTTVSGFLLTPSKEKEGASDCVYVTHTNFKGSLPEMITNIIAKSQGFKILTIRDAMEKKFGKK